MLTAIRKFFDQHIAPQPHEAPASATRGAKTGAAVLLVEGARSDQTFSHRARQAVLGPVQPTLGLSPPEAQELLAVAESESQDAHDLYHFTSRIDAPFPP